MSLFDMNDPQSVGLMSLGLRLMSTPGGLGRALGQSGLGAMGDVQGAQSAQQQRELAALQITRAKMEQERAIETARREKLLQQAQDQFKNTLVSPQMQASQTALAGGGGPTVSNAASMPAVDPNANLMFGAMQSGMMSPLDYLKLQQKDTTPIKLGAGEKLLKPGTFQELATNPKDALGTSDMQNYAAVKMQGYQGTLNDFLKEQANLKAPKTSVAVNMGQKGYENESKLRNDFKSEPIYKDYQDMQSAHKQIKAGIAQGTPIGDVATATKIMKLLDPGSVVRESELGIAMAAGGRMDRLKHFVELQLSGQKLTPTMRKEFGSLADELMSVAGQAYNAKRDEYAKFGKRYALDENVLGAPYKKGGVINFGDMK